MEVPVVRDYICPECNQHLYAYHDEDMKTMELTCYTRGSDAQCGSTNCPINNSGKRFKVPMIKLEEAD